MPADAERLLEVSLDAIRTSASAEYTPAQQEAWCARRTLDGHRRMIDEATVLVAVVGEEVVGFASLVLAMHELDQLYVSPRAGGRGVARALLAAAHAAAAEAGLTQLDARASDRAVGVFEAAGYARLEREVVELDGERLGRFHVRRPLQEP